MPIPQGHSLVARIFERVLPSAPDVSEMGALGGAAGPLHRADGAVAADRRRRAGCRRARKAERRVEKLYRAALAELFQGDQYIQMFKKREIYRHLTNAAECMAHCASTLHDIVVKTV